MFLNALTSILLFILGVNKLTAGTTINGKIMAMLAAIGAFLGPKTKKRIIAVSIPVIMPDFAPIRVVLFQYNP